MPRRPPFPLPASSRLRKIFDGLPPFEGDAIDLRFKARLRAHRGQLLSGGRLGAEVHAGSFVRKRLIVLDSALKRNESELIRILLHELFHFVWVRLGNQARHSYEELLGGELRRSARGEMGWSAECRKEALTAERIAGRTRLWREYVCESFCDSAASIAAGIADHGESTLAPRFRRRRDEWFGIILNGSRILI